MKSLDAAGLSLMRRSAACLDCSVVGADIRLNGNLGVLRATRADKLLEALEALESPFSARCCGKERSRCAHFLCLCGRHEARTVAGPKSIDLGVFVSGWQKVKVSSSYSVKWRS